jgi:hypothetical protein
LEHAIEIPRASLEPEIPINFLRRSFKIEEASLPSISTQSLTTSVKPVGVGRASQRLILTGERSGSQTRIAMMANASLCGPMKKLTAFVELESAVRESSELS